MFDIPTRIKTLFNEPVYQIAFFVFLFEAAFVPERSAGWDHNCFCHWCVNLHQYGISYAYHILGEFTFNYPPLICYPMAVFGKLAGTEANITRYFYLFKLFPLLFDFIAALLIVHLTGNSKRSVLFLLLLIVNPAFIFNSYAWGQYDGVFSALIFISFYFLLEKRLVWTAVFFTLAINFKPQSVVFLPPLFLLGFYTLWGKANWKDIWQSLLAMVVVEVIILFPFIITGELSGLIRTVKGTVDFYPALAPSASNLWYLFFGEASRSTSDQGIWLGLTYKNWGLLLFCTASFIALLPLFVSTVSKMFLKSAIEIAQSSVFISFALIPLVFYFFCTQMHSRYSHPALIFIALFVFSQKKYLLFVLMCLAYLASAELDVQFFKFPNYEILFFNPFFIASLYLLVIISLFYYLYRPFILTLKGLHYGQRPVEAVGQVSAI